MATPTRIIDDLGQPAPRASNGADWDMIADRVMGGVSSGRLTRETLQNRPALRLTGDVSLDNNGGFLQMALDLEARGNSIDASAWTGLELDVIGNGQTYNLHLRTADVTRPWQSYRASFTAPGHWETLQIPFTDFVPHRLQAPLDLTTLRRVGIVAIGREFAVDIALGGLRFFA